MGKKKKNSRLKAKGIDVEFSQELADEADLVAQQRALETNARVKARQKKSK